MLLEFTLQREAPIEDVNSISSPKLVIVLPFSQKSFEALKVQKGGFLQQSINAKLLSLLGFNEKRGSPRMKREGFE